MMKSIFVLNWKMYGSLHHVTNFTEKLESLFLKDEVCIFCPPIIYSAEALKVVAKYSNANSVAIGAQDFSPHSSFAHTGDISIDFLQDLNISYAIVGHSERRVWHKEDVTIIAKKLNLAVENSITPIYCFGETSLEVDDLAMEVFLEAELNYVASFFNNCDHFILAYEPIWNIGSDCGASGYPFIKRNLILIKNYLRKMNIQNVSLLYGGSVNAKSIALMNLSREIVDGYIVGGASTNFDELSQIVSYDREGRGI